VRYARFSFAGGEVRSAAELVEFHERPLPPETFSEGPLGGGLQEPEALHEAIGQVVDLASDTVDRASLVVPDDWLRVSFAELDGLPQNEASRHEMVLWKLKSLVPFRVEDLRVAHQEVEPLPEQAEEHRLMVGFGIESLLQQLEERFVEREIRIGRVTNESLSLLGAVSEERDILCATAAVTDEGYTILFSKNELPVLYRYKGLDPTSGERRVIRDLRLSRMFLAEQLADSSVSKISLLAPTSLAEVWRDWLASTFDAPVVDLEAEGVGLSALPGGVEWPRVATLIGATRQEVA